VLFGPLAGEEMERELRPRLVDILPRSLKRLDLVEYDPPVVGQLLDLLRQRNELVPDLEVIRLEDCIEHSGPFGQEKQPADPGKRSKSSRRNATMRIFVSSSQTSAHEQPTIMIGALGSQQQNFSKLSVSYKCPCSSIH